MTSGVRTARAWSEWEGRIVDGKFPLKQYLGGTDQSAVFLTEREGEPRQAAIKLVPINGPAAEELLARWTAAVQLSHADLMSIFEIGRSSVADIAVAYVVMEYAEEDLGQVDRSLTASEASDMLHGVLGALSYLHGKGLAHGHLKPSNILAVGDQLKISSDSIRPSGKRNERLDPPGLCDPPEVAWQGPSPAGDVWSIGVTLVAALTQRTPTFDGTGVSVDLLQNLPVRFRSIVSNCLSADPGQRLTVAAIRQSLESGPQEPPHPPVEPHPNVANRRYLLIAAAVVFAVAAWAIASRLASDRASGALPRIQPQDSKAVALPDPPAAAAASKAPPPSPSRSPGPKVLTQVLPDVPAKARNTIRGKVAIHIRVHVDGAGSVVDAQNQSPQSSRFFGNLALQAARRWKFAPDPAGSSAQPAEWNLQFQFVRDPKKPVSVKAVPAAH